MTISFAWIWGGMGGLSLPWIGRKSFDCNGLDRRGRKPVRTGP